MSGEWQQLGSFNTGDLAATRLQAHYAVQWLARAARGYAKPVPDDSHTSLTWDAGEAAFIGNAIGAASKLRFGYRPGAMSLFVSGHDDFDGNVEIELAGQTDADVRTWVRNHVILGAEDPGALEHQAPYEMPPHGISDGAQYSADAQAQTELERVFANAALLLDDVVAAQSGASPLRCWPHHFDIATLISLDQTGGEDARSIGVGLSPGDESYADPYFYVSPWPYPDIDALPDLEGDGHWHTDGFVAAVATLSDVVAAADQRRWASAWLTRSIGYCHFLLEEI